jgi:hypothetical protein
MNSHMSGLRVLGRKQKTLSPVVGERAVAIATYFK